MSDTPATAPAFAEEIMLLAEKLGELNERLAKAEADLATQTAPLDATKAAQDATLAALSAALSGIKALNFHVLGNDLGAVSKRVEVVAEQADTAIKAMSAQIAESQSAILSAKGTFAQQIAQTDAQRMELARKRDGDAQAFTAKFGELQLELNRVRESLAGELQAAIKQFATPAGLNPRGPWDALKSYKRLDVVSLNGSSYLAANDTTEKPDKKSKSWQVLARRGSQGGGAVDITGISGFGPVGLQVAQAGTALDIIHALQPVMTYSPPATASWSISTTLSFVSGATGYRTQTRLDLSQFSKARICVMTGATAPPASTEIHLRYHTASSVTIGDFKPMATFLGSTVDLVVTPPESANTCTAGEWLDLVAGAKGDVFVVVTGLAGGSATIGLQNITVQFK